MLSLPKLARSGVFELVKCPAANHGFQFLAGWRNTSEEISDGNKWGALAGIEDRIGGMRCESLHAGQRHTDGRAMRHEGWAGFIDRWRQELQTKPMGFQRIN